MSDEYSVTKIVSLGDLTKKVERILGEEHPISIKFREAADNRDPDIMEEAMELLDNATKIEQESVHEAVLLWLLGSDDAPESHNLMEMESPSSMVH